MPHAHRKTDLDTNTGLPRKTVSRLFLWLTGLLQAIAVAFLIKLNSDVDKLKTDVAYIKGKSGIVAVPGTPVVAANLESPDPMP